MGCHISRLKQASMNEYVNIALPIHAVKLVVFSKFQKRKKVIPVISSVMFIH